jgi:N-acetyl-gamma-glutamyl-phosphate reductase/acetylglutamate kinase
MAVRRYGAAAVARGAALQPRCRGAAAAVAAQPSPCRNFSTTIASKPLPARTQRVVVEQILRAVGSAQDAEEFQRIYGSGERHYAVVKAGGEVIRDELDTFVAGLATMKAVGLFPIVVHGAGPQMNEVMDQQGIEPNYVGGLRVTDEHVLGATTCHSIVSFSPAPPLPPHTSPQWTAPCCFGLSVAAACARA